MPWTIQLTVEQAATVIRIASEVCHYNPMLMESILMSVQDLYKNKSVVLNFNHFAIKTHTRSIPHYHIYMMLNGNGLLHKKNLTMYIPVNDVFQYFFFQLTKETKILDGALNNISNCIEQPIPY